MSIKRTTMVLGAIAIALMGYILMFERGSLSTGELEGRRGRVLERFVRAHVTRLEVVSGDTHVTLAREEQGEDEETLDTFGVGLWHLEVPVRAEADGEAVDGLLSALEYLDARRTLEGITSEDRERFGLASPRATVAFVVAGETHHLAIGGADPRGEGVYASVDDDGRAWIVGQDILDELAHDASHYRRKELFHHFVPRDVRRVELSNVDTHAVLARSEGDEGLGPWRLTEPVDGYARVSTIDALLGVLSHVRAARFLAEEIADPAPYGLAQPSREIVVERAPAEPGAAAGADAHGALRLRIGGACPEHESEVVAVAGDGPVVCVLASDVDELDASLDRLRETRLVSSADDRVDTITFAEGEHSFRVRRVEGGWSVVVDEDAQPADETAVGELMQALRGQEAQQFVPVTDAALAEHGLDHPRATLTIARTDDERDEVVAVGNEDAVGVWVRRGDEAQIARFDAGASALLFRTAISFRARRLAERDVEDAEQVRVTRGSASEVVLKVDGQWRVREPADQVADGAAVRDVARVIGGLEALRFVAEAAAPEHGLAHPRFSVTVHFAASERHEDGDHDDHHEDDESDAESEAADVTLHVGAATEGGAFATLNDAPAVFVVAQSVVDALAMPLVSRDLLALPTSEISQLTITSPGGRVVLHASEGGWTSESGPVAEGPATALFDRLASLRASGVEAYGAAAPAAVVTIEAQRRGGELTTIRIGAPIGEGAAAYRLATISGVDAVFRLPEEAAAALADYRP
jgi:hypothetical protein